MDPCLPRALAWWLWCPSNMQDVMIQCNTSRPDIKRIPTEDEASYVHHQSTTLFYWPGVKWMGWPFNKNVTIGVLIGTLQKGFALHRTSCNESDDPGVAVNVDCLPTWRHKSGLWCLIVMPSLREGHVPRCRGTTSLQTLWCCLVQFVVEKSAHVGNIQRFKGGFELYCWDEWYLICFRRSCHFCLWFSCKGLFWACLITQHIKLTHYPTVAAQGNVAGFSLNSLTSRRRFETFSAEVGSYQDEEGGPVCKTSLGSSAICWAERKWNK